MANTGLSVVGSFGSVTSPKASIVTNTVTRAGLVPTNMLPLSTLTTFIEVTKTLIKSGAESVSTLSPSTTGQITRTITGPIVTISLTTEITKTLPTLPPTSQIVTTSVTGSTTTSAAPTTPLSPLEIDGNQDRTAKKLTIALLCISFAFAVAVLVLLLLAAKTWQHHKKRERARRERLHPVAPAPEEPAPADIEMQILPPKPEPTVMPKAGDEQTDERRSISSLESLRGHETSQVIPDVSAQQTVHADLWKKEHPSSS